MALNVGASTDSIRSAERSNNFNLIRMVAASAVLISHAYPLALGPQATEPLTDTLGVNLGTLSVITFFAISGYFISQSYDRSRSVIDFVIARILRIYPGLTVVVMLAALILGPIVTKIPAKIYFLDIATYAYVPRNLSLFFLQYDLPGVFTDNPLPGAVNGSLWTLFYEVACYGMVVCVGVSGFVLSGRRFGFFLALYALLYASILWLDNHYGVLSRSHFLRNCHTFVLPFIIGMSMYYFRRKLHLALYLVVIAIAATILSYRRPWFHEIFVLSWSYSLFYLGFTHSPVLLAYNRIGDYSYGMYIYAFPVEQVGAALLKRCTPVELIAFSFPITLLLAVSSWHFLEKRALLLRSSASKWVQERGRLIFRNGARSVREVRSDIH